MVPLVILAPLELESHSSQAVATFLVTSHLTVSSLDPPASLTLTRIYWKAMLQPLVWKHLWPVCGESG